MLLQADHLIDLGPEGGDRGGEVMVTGTPEEVAEWAPSYTGNYIKKILAERGRKKSRPKGTLNEPAGRSFQSKKQGATGQGKKTSAGLSARHK